MTTQIVRSCFAVVSAVIFAAGLHAAALVGEPAPAFTLTDINGTVRNLSDFKGKTVVLEWVNPECPFVKKHYEKSDNIPSLQKAAAADGVVWLSINSAAAGKQGDFDTAKVAAWTTKTKAAPTAYLRDSDGKVGKAYDAKTTPQIFIVNAAGVIVYAGGIDSIKSADADDIAKAQNYVAAALASIKAGHPITHATTQSYGCSVKY